MTREEYIINIILASPNQEEMISLLFEKMQEIEEARKA